MDSAVQGGHITNHKGTHGTILGSQDIGNPGTQSGQDEPTDAKKPKKKRGSAIVESDSESIPGASGGGLR